MGLIAFVFPGQGAQQPGMGKALYEAVPEARAQLDRLNALWPDLLPLCFEGTQEQLKDTNNAHPCLYAVSLATARALHARGLKPDITAGFSLGEVTALSFAGLFSGDEGFRFVRRRAAIMADEAALHPGSMAAVLKLSNAQVEALCQGIPGVWPVNYNAPGQVAVAGSDEGIKELGSQAQPLGGRLIPLKVSGAFHSPLMDGAQTRLESELSAYAFQPLQLPVIANLPAQPYGEDPRGTHANQVNHPVLWQQSVEEMINRGVTRFVEVGGNVLKGLISRIDSAVTVISATDPDNFDEALGLKQ